MLSRFQVQVVTPATQHHLQVWYESISWLALYRNLQTRMFSLKVAKLQLQRHRNPKEGESACPWLVLAMADEGGTVKVVVVGDGTTGKTCLLVRFADEKFSEEYIVWSWRYNHLLFAYISRLFLGSHINDKVWEKSPTASTRGEKLRILRESCLCFFPWETCRWFV